MRSPAIWVAGLLLVVVAFVVGTLGGGGDRFSEAARPESFYDATYAVLRTVPLDERASSLATLFALARVDDLDGIARAYETTHIGVGPGAVEADLLGELFARLDPVAGMARAAGWRTFWNRQMLSPLMRAWARLDLDAARARASAIEPEKTRSLAESSIALGRFAAEGDAAWDGYWRAWPFGDAVFPEIQATIVQREGLAKLFERVESLPPEAPDELRARALRLAAGLGGLFDPVSTCGFVEAHADDPVEGLKNLRAPFVDAWSQSDPRAALDWLMSQPPSGQRAVATRIAFRPWVFDPETRLEAIEWIERQPPEILSPVRDFYAMALLHVDHERAIEAAEQIQGPNRDNVLRRVKQMISVREKQEQKAAEAAARAERSGREDEAKREAPSPLPGASL